MVLECHDWRLVHQTLDVLAVMSGRLQLVASYTNVEHVEEVE